MSQGNFDVAVVGLALRVPGSPDAASFWANLCAGRSGVRDLKPHELDRDAVVEPRRVMAWGALDDIDLFDAGLFGMSALEAELTDPQVRLTLECAWSALEDAGCVPDGQGRVSVYLGGHASDYLSLIRRRPLLPSEDFKALIANGLDYLPTIVSYRLGLTGESVAVQTACSTSLVAIHLACQSLLLGQSDVALAGGASVRTRQRSGYLFEEGMPFSRDGRTRSYDSAGGGTGVGSGLGVVVLKRLDDALANRDRIYAVVKGSAVNNDGRAKAGYSAPSVSGQRSVIETALELSGVDPATITMLEGHGTATALGDPIEVEALRQSYRRSTQAVQYCALGSVKSNVGHLVEAAGVVGFIKATLAIANGAIPPSIHHASPNPEIHFEETPFFVNTRLLDWRPACGTRRAGVSSFGIGGTNAHAVLEEASPVALPPSSGPALFVLSAHSAAALEAYREQLASWLVTNPTTHLQSLAFTLATGRRPLAHRFATVADDTAQLALALRAPASPAEVRAEHLIHSERGAAPARRNDRAALGALATAWQSGQQVDWATLWEGAGVRRLTAPGVPFQRSRYWVDEGAATTGGPRSGQTEVFGLAGEDASDLPRAATILQNLSHALQDIRALSVASLSLASGPARAALRASSVVDLRRQLGQVTGGNFDGATRGRANGRVARGPIFLFGGYGTQWQGMLGTLANEPACRDVIERCDAWMMQEMGWSPVAVDRDADAARFEAADVVQPLVFIAEMALVALWRSWNVEPVAVLGHSFGEVAAATTAGALELLAGLEVIARRGLAVREHAPPSGGMAIFRLSDARISELLAAHPALSVGAYNSPTVTVLTGRRDLLTNVVDSVAAQGEFARLVRIDFASHSASMREARNALVVALAQVPNAVTQFPVISTVTGAAAGGEMRFDPEYWGRNLEQPVHLRRALEFVGELGHDAYLELSPHPVLLPNVEDTLARGERKPVLLPSMRRGEAVREVALASLAALWVRGRTSVPQRSASSEKPRTAANRSEHAQVDALVTREVAELLRVPPAGLSKSVPLLDQGLDSVAALKLVAVLDEQLGVRLTARELLGARTLDAVIALCEAPAITAGATADARADGSSATPVASSAVDPTPPTADPQASTRPARPRLEILRNASAGAPLVFLCPGAGGSSSQLSRWATPDLAGDAAVASMHTLGLTPEDDIADLADVAASVAAELMALGRPVVLLGFSLGAILAHAIAAALSQRGAPPLHVILCHSLPPDAQRQRALSEAPEFQERWRRLYDLFQVSDVDLSRYIDSVHAFFKAVEDYGRITLTPLPCPATVLASPEDQVVTPFAAVAGWDACFAATRHVRVVGTHLDVLLFPENRAALRAAFAVARPTR